MVKSTIVATILFFAAIFVIAASALGIGYFFRIAGIGAAYKAKTLCSAIFVSGLTLDPDRADEVSAEAYRILRLFRARVDAEARTVTASFLGLKVRRATFRPGLGSSLAFGELRPMSPAPARVALPPQRPWPDGDGLVQDESPALARVLEKALVEEGPKLRRTRAVLVVEDGRLVCERYAPGFSATTPLNGWSMTKSVMAALIGILIGEGRLRIDSRGLLAEWSGDNDPRAAISLEDLLRMRSGLSFTEKYSDPLSDVNRMLFDGPDTGGFAAARPLAQAPGSHWKYASGTTNLLSLIARRAVGEQKYASWPRRALFDPISMNSAVFEPDASGTFIASSYLFATGRDWARFGWLHAADGVWQGRRILPERWVRFVTTPEPLSKGGGAYGAHWWLKISKDFGGDTEAARKVPSDAFHASGHEGQCLTVIPSKRLVVVRLGLSIDVSAWNHAEFLDEVLSAIG